MIPVAGALPQGSVEHDGRLDLLIACFPVNLAPVVFQTVAQDHSLGVEEGEAGALVPDVEQAQLAVVALLGFFDAGQIGVQLGLVGEGGAVDALQHLVLFIAAPVSAGDGGQLESLDLAGGGHMRARAQVGEVALTVEGNVRVLGQVADQLHLVGLALFFHEFDGFFPGQLEAFQLVVLLDDAAHFLLHFLQEVGGEGLVHVKVVVEAVVDGGADGQLGLGMQLFHGLSQHVAGGVAQHPLGLVVLKGKDLQLTIMVDGLPQLHDLAVHPGAQRLLFQLLTELTGNLQRGHAVFKLPLAVFQGNQHGFLLLVFGERKTPPRFRFRRGE